MIDYFGWNNCDQYLIYETLWSFFIKPLNCWRLTRRLKFANCFSVQTNLFVFGAWFISTHFINWFHLIGNILHMPKNISLQNFENELILCTWMFAFQKKKFKLNLNGGQCNSLFSGDLVFLFLDLSFTFFMDNTPKRNVLIWNWPVDWFDLNGDLLFLCFNEFFICLHMIHSILVCIDCVDTLTASISFSVGWWWWFVCLCVTLSLCFCVCFFLNDDRLSIEKTIF